MSFMKNIFIKNLTYSVNLSTSYDLSIIAFGAATAIDNISGKSVFCWKWEFRILIKPYNLKFQKLHKIMNEKLLSKQAIVKFADKLISIYLIIKNINI